MKPTIVYVSGAPGSGKTTLAKLLSEHLYIPQVSSDLIQGGVELTHPHHDRRAAIDSGFVPLLIDMAKKDISFVVDHVLQKNVARATIIDKLLQNARVIYIHVQSADPIGRYVHRIETSELPDIIRRRSMLLERAEYHRENLINTLDPLELDIPTIVVDTNSGYEPTLERIIMFVHEHSERA